MASPARLCGAWSLTGEPLERLLPESRRREALDAAQPLESHVTERLWLAAAPGKLARDAGRVAAWDGFLFPGPGGPWALSAPPANARNAPAGHYVCAHAQAGRGELSLVRDPSGGERLYFCREGALLLFASSLKVLLRLRGRPAALDAERAFERGVAELVCFGDGTFVEGVSELLPGHRLRVSDRLAEQEWLWGGLLEPLEGDVASLGWRLRGSLKDAVARCVGDDGRVAVALSGGVDSASVAALAVELLGPERVEAFTYEYQDPEHPSEVAVAASICRRLGIREHHVVPIGFEEFADAAPRAVWLAEDPGHWKRSYPLALARAVESRGFDRFVTGFGIGSHMGWLDECARAAPRLRLRQWTLRYWKSPKGRLGAALARLHPGLEPPMHRLLYPALAHLRGWNALSDLTPFFPAPLGQRVEALARSPRVRRDIAALEGRMRLGAQLQFLAFTHMNSCADVARCERPSREAGAAWLGPAHFPSTLPYCYLPLKERPPLWSAARRRRPGKALLLEAMRGDLPEELVARRKDWSQTIGSRRWRDRLLARMDAAAGPSWDALREIFGTSLDAAKRHAPEGMIPLAFWHRLFVAGRFTSPPSWRDLA